MACSKCKKKTLVQKEFKKEFGSTDVLVTWGVIIWSLLGAYGLYKLIIEIIQTFK
jgi:hypothetical protein